MSRRIRAAVMLVTLTVLCCGCSPPGSGSDTAADVGATADVAVDEAANHDQIRRLQETKQALQAQIESLRSAGTATVPATPQPSATATDVAPSVSGSTVAGTGRAGSSATAGLAEQFAALERTLSGRNGLAIAPIGDRDDVVNLGDWTAGAAWSTIKVPMAVAAVRAEHGHPSDTTSALIRRAITVSDNAAAEALWAGLGSSTTAASAVGAVLRDGGDPLTRVQARRVRAGFTPFGQTVWALRDQARMAAMLPCLSGAGPALTSMGQVTRSQRWGLGLLGPETRFKGGWGPDPEGRYLVRQFGVVPLPAGDWIAVALASQPTDGSFTTATANLGAMAGWLRHRLPLLTGGRC